MAHAPTLNSTMGSYDLGQLFTKFGPSPSFLTEKTSSCRRLGSSYRATDLLCSGTLRRIAIFRTVLSRFNLDWSRLVLCDALVRSHGKWILLSTENEFLIIKKRLWHIEYGTLTEIVNFFISLAITLE
jgi:hypothetical protein